MKPGVYNVQVLVPTIECFAVRTDGGLLAFIVDLFAEGFPSEGGEAWAVHEVQEGTVVAAGEEDTTACLWGMCVCVCVCVCACVDPPGDLHNTHAS